MRHVDHTTVIRGRSFHGSGMDDQVWDLLMGLWTNAVTWFSTHLWTEHVTPEPPVSRNLTISLASVEMKTFTTTSGTLSLSPTAPVARLDAAQASRRAVGAIPAQLRSLTSTAPEIASFSIRPSGMQPAAPARREIGTITTRAGAFHASSTAQLVASSPALVLVTGQPTVDPERLSGTTTMTGSVAASASQTSVTATSSPSTSLTTTSPGVT